jgi:hypothetical protein
MTLLSFSHTSKTRTILQIQSEHDSILHAGTTATSRTLQMLIFVGERPPEDGGNPCLKTPTDIYREAISRWRVVPVFAATGGFDGLRIKPEPVGFSSTSASG